MNLKMSLWDSIIWLVKLGEHGDRMALKWEDPELGTDAGIKKWLISKPSHSVGSSTEIHQGNTFLSLPLSSLLCPCPEWYLSTKWVAFLNVESSLCLPMASLKTSFSSVTLKCFQGDISQKMCMGLTHTTTKKVFLEFFVSLSNSATHRCHRTSELRIMEWQWNGYATWKDRATLEIATQSKAIADSLDLGSSWWF